MILGGIGVMQDYACIGVDGIPIGYSNPITNNCCDGNGNLISPPSPACSAGFNSVGPDALKPYALVLSAAQQTIALTSSLNGNNIDATAPVEKTMTNINAPTAESAASIAGNSAGTNGSNSAANNANSNANSTNGKTGNSASAGGGSTGLSIGASGGTSAPKGSGVANADSNNQQTNNGSGYTKSGETKAAGGSNNPFGGLFGGGGSGGEAKGAGAGANELTFGDGNKDGNTNAANGTDDGDGKGSAEDPNDYFNRIDKSANLFKIVSARYMKKKSLWPSKN